MEDILKDSWEPKGPISKKIKERIKKPARDSILMTTSQKFIEEARWICYKQKCRKNYKVVSGQSCYRYGKRS